MHAKATFTHQDVVKVELLFFERRIFFSLLNCLAFFCVTSWYRTAVKRHGLHIMDLTSAMVRIVITDITMINAICSASMRASALRAERAAVRGFEKIY